MKAKSKKTGKIFTGKLADLAVKAGFADPFEEEADNTVAKSAVTKKPVRKKPVKAAKKPVKKQVEKVKK